VLGSGIPKPSPSAVNKHLEAELLKGALRENTNGLVYRFFLTWCI
jgi:hypothetical protein